jgi:hypothetical protein
MNDRSSVRRQPAAHRGGRLILLGALGLALVVAVGALVVGPAMAPPASVRAVPTCDDAIQRVQQYPVPAPGTGTLQQAVSSKSPVANAASNYVVIDGWEGVAAADSCRVSWGYHYRGQANSAEWDWNPTTNVVRPLTPLARTLLGES